MRTGREIPRKWNDEYIDAPIIGMQRQPTSDGAGVSKIVLRPATIECSITRGVWTTTRREALGLEIDKHIASDFRTRLQWAERIGLGFELPGANLGNLRN